MPKETKTPTSVLQSFLDEYQLSPFSLSKAISISSSSARSIVTGRTRISVHIALRLSKLFGNTPEFWLALQREAEFAEAAKDKKLQAALKQIKKARKPTAVSKAPAKPRRKTTLSDKRKKAASVPGAKPVSRKKN